MTPDTLLAWTNWIETWTIFGPVSIMFLGFYLAYDANRWRWGRKAPKARRK